MFPLEFCGEVNSEETRVMGLSYSEDRIIVAGVVLAWYQRVTDGQTVRETGGQTDGRTESIIANTALCIAMLMRCENCKVHNCESVPKFAFSHRLCWSSLQQCHATTCTVIWLCQSMHVHLTNNPAKLHSDPIWNDEALGLFLTRLHGDGDDGITTVMGLAFMTDTAVITGMGTVGSTAEAVT